LKQRLCINKHGASKIIDTLETYHRSCSSGLACGGLAGLLLAAHDVIALVSCVVRRLRDACIFVSCLALAAIVYAARGRTIYSMCDTHLCVAYAARLQRAVQPLAGWAVLVAIA
jgi:hypothetical protein